MQESFLKKVVLSLIIASMLAGVVEFYKVFVTGADEALNGKHGHTHFNAHPPSPHP